MKNSIIVAIMLVLALSFGLSLVSNPKSNQSLLALNVKTTLFDWAISINSDDYVESKYFTVDKPANYLFYAKGNAPKGQITISILNSSGQVVREIKGSHLNKEQPLFLSPGNYRVIVKTKNCKHNNFRIYVYKAK